MKWLDDRVPQPVAVSDPNLSRWVKDATRAFKAILPTLRDLCANVAVSYSYTQTTPSTIWQIPHNFGYYPVVGVWDRSGNPLTATITNPSVNLTVLTFGTAQSGSARCI